MASLPSLQISEKVALGEGGVIDGKRVKRLVDLSTTGSAVAGGDLRRARQEEHCADR